MKRLMKTALIALMVLALVACAGCKKKKTAEPAAAPAAEPASAPVVESAPAPAEEPAAAPAEEPAAAPAEEPVAGIPNPWSETKDASEAITGAGLDDLLRFSSRIPQKLFGLELQGFRYMAGTLEADYANSANEAFLRISKDLSGIEGLAGDYNKYSQEWEGTFYGVTIHACGGQDRVNVAAFDALGLHFAAGCNLGSEGAGVPFSAVRSLAARIQIPDYLAAVMKAPAAAPAEEPAAAPAEEPAEAPAEEPAVAPAEEPVVGIPNPWVETKDASEAIAGAGMNYLLLFSNIIPQKLFGLELQGFRYMDGTLEADYANSANEAFLRISKNASGIEGLAGDYNEYSQEWNVAVYGVNLQARGGQDRVNVAAFDALGFHFAVGCNLGNEGAGVPLNAVQSLVPRVRIPDSFLKLIGK